MRRVVLVLFTVALASPALAQDPSDAALKAEVERVRLFDAAIRAGEYTPPTVQLAPGGVEPMQVYTPAKSSDVHVVAAGDTLFSIAKARSVEVSALRLANGLHGNALSIGQRLRVPSTVIETDFADRQRHIVKQGDTLFSIGKAHCVSVDSLVAANRLSDGVAIQPGQGLNIPGEGCPSA